MKKILLLGLLMQLLTSCSSIHDMPSKDKLRGDYLFNQKLKTEYTKFFVDGVFKNGMFIYAGPSFLKFNNFQMIKLDRIGLSTGGMAVYTAEDGARHEYTSHTPLQPYYGDKSDENTRIFQLDFGALFKSFQQVERQDIKLIVTIKCKKDIDCHLIPDIDFALFNDPYDIGLKLQDEDLIINENVILSNFSDYDATCIAGRMIYQGMDQKAAELAIGKGRWAQGNAYRDVVFKDGKVYSFKFGNYNYDLHYFNRY